VTATLPSLESDRSVPVERITPSYDGLEELFDGEELEFVRLSCETVGSAEIVGVELPGVSFKAGTWAWANLTRGSSAPGRMLFEMVPDPGDAFFHDVQAVPGAVHTHGPSSQLLDTSTPQTRFLVVSIETELLERSVATLDRDGSLLAPGRFKVFTGETAGRFQRLSTSLATVARRVGDAGIPRAFAQRLRDDLVTGALDMMESNEPPTTVPCIRHFSAIEIVTACDDYAAARRYRAITSLDLSRVAGYSERRIRAAFKEITGVSPMRFMRSRALHQVRLDLLSGTAPSVTDVALAWGFTELGRFSRMYRDQFGELPSRTLDDSRHRSFPSPRRFQPAHA
jgi:AraC-like DNA-binding protein